MTSTVHEFGGYDENRSAPADPNPVPPPAGWTFRQLAFHLAGSVYYADAVGDLTPGRSDPTP